MTRQIWTGNQAVAWGALRAGVRVVTGYPGTPSTGCVEHLLHLALPGRHVEWSTNEKVALEIAAGAAWAGQRAMCTMKMSGVNVAFDALISIAYSGTNGGLVIYVADDPGVSAGMPEQDSRGFALMSYLPMLEPSSPAHAYEMVQQCFELSERTGAPVFLRLTTAVALGHAALQVGEPAPPTCVEPVLERDIARYTKAGSKICLDQHQAAIERLSAAGRIVQEMGINRVHLGSGLPRIGIIAVGAANACLDEALTLAEGESVSGIATLRAVTTNPFPRTQVEQILSVSHSVIVLEELEPHFEREVYVVAQQSEFRGRIVGKLDGTLGRLGEYSASHIRSAIYKAAGMAAPGRVGAQAAAKLGGLPPDREIQGAAQAAPRPITVCAGCPHRGTYLAIEDAIKQAGFSKDDVMVTGDIGCTILGMNPPFHLLWNEVSMGSSVSLAQGYVHGGLRTPVIATMGDSTFFHAGLPGLINAIQHRVPLTLVVMDNGWTSMTGMQVNPGTPDPFQEGDRRIDLERVIRGLQPDRFAVVDPFDLQTTSAAVLEGLRNEGVSVVLARRECAIQARRHGERAGRTTLDADRCVLCKRCLRVTGCPALSVADRDPRDAKGLGAAVTSPAPQRSSGRTRGTMTIDPSLCNGCGLCARFCPTGALDHRSEHGLEVSA